MSSGDRLATVQFLPPSTCFEVALLNAEVSVVSTKPQRGPDLDLDAGVLSAHLLARFAGQVLTSSQELTFEYQVRADGWDLAGGWCGLLWRDGRRRRPLAACCCQHSAMMPPPVMVQSRAEVQWDVVARL